MDIIGTFPCSAQNGTSGGGLAVLRSAHLDGDKAISQVLADHVAAPYTIMMTPLQFLTTLWGDPPPGPVLVWTLPDKQSRWYRRFDTVNEDMRQHADHDVYVEAGLAPGKGVRLTSRTRVSEEDVAGIPALWADVDVAHPVHAKAAQLPPDRERAIDVLAQLPMHPTILVDTGHGLHAWWVFSEPWIFSGDEEFHEARRTIQWWQQTIKAHFSERGWTIDSTFDLSRLMRLPGTWNNKTPNDRRPVEVVRNTGQLYCKEIFSDLVPDDFEATPLGSRKTKSRGKGKESPPSRGKGKESPPNPGLVLDPDAEPPFLKLEVLLDHDRRFRSTWRHTRPDLSDQSPSGYDLVVGAHRRPGRMDRPGSGEPPDGLSPQKWVAQKLRMDYFETTLRKAKTSFEHEHVVQSALDMADSLDSAGEKGESANSSRQEGGADDRSQMLKTLSQLFRKVDIQQIDRFSGATTTYVMVTDRGRVHLRGIQDVLNQTRFIERVAEETGEVLDIRLKKPQWNRVAQLMLHAGVDHDMGEVGSPETECQVWIEGYLIDRGMVDDVSQAASQHVPLLHEARIHIYLYDLMEWVHHQLGVKADRHDMAEGLLTLGWSPARFNVVVGGRRTTYRSWRCGEDYQPIDG